MVGHAKTCLVLAGGFLLWPPADTSHLPTQLVGVSVAVLGCMLYFFFNVCFFFRRLGRRPRLRALRPSQAERGYRPERLVRPPLPRAAAVGRDRPPAEVRDTTRDTAEMQLEIQPRCSPRYSRDTAGMQPRCSRSSRDPDEILPSSCPAPAEAQLAYSRGTYSRGCTTPSTPPPANQVRAAACVGGAHPGGGPIRVGRQGGLIIMIN